MLQPALEPMQIDAAPEENDNSVEEPVPEVLTACIDLDSYIASYKGTLPWGNGIVDILWSDRLGGVSACHGYCIIHGC